MIISVIGSILGFAVHITRSTWKTPPCVSMLISIGMACARSQLYVHIHLLGLVPGSGMYLPSMPECIIATLSLMHAYAILKRLLESPPDVISRACVYQQVIIRLVAPCVRLFGAMCVPWDTRTHRVSTEKLTDVKGSECSSFHGAQARPGLFVPEFIIISAVTDARLHAR